MGTDTSNVYILNTERLTLSGCWIRWKNIADVYVIKTQLSIHTKISEFIISYRDNTLCKWEVSYVHIKVPARCGNTNLECYLTYVHVVM